MVPLPTVEVLSLGAAEDPRPPVRLPTSPSHLPCDDALMAALPAGTVTLVLGDIEGSTRLWEERPDDMPGALARLEATVVALADRHHGVRPIEQGEGDSFVVAFELASDAIAFATDLQLELVDDLLRLRIGVHTGEVQQRDAHTYMGTTINRTARIRDAGHGSQVLVSHTTVDLLQDQLPDSVGFIDLGACRLRDLGRAVHLWQLTHPDLPKAFPPPRGLDIGPTNLPLQLTSFVGRGEVVTHLHAALDTDRAVTITGAGGCGKTRVALQVAADRVDRYPGGTWLVDFAPLNDAGAVAAAVAEVVGATLRPGDPAAPAIAAAIGDIPTLLVLDNCEHVVDECARFVEHLLRACSGSTVLATSREPLGVAGEVTFRLPSLATPANAAPSTATALRAFDAVELFAERAVRANPGFVVDDATAPIVAEICRRLDGMPLAIELAAARVRVLTPTQILDGLRDRFRLLTGGGRTAVPRHQTLQASVDWSYALLLEPERLLLHRLSVFAGGFSLDAAQAVGAGGQLEAHHVLDLLLQLVDKSLVVSADESSRGRFSLLETVRQYAAARLVDSGEAHELRRRHFDFYFAFVKQRLETVDDYRRRIEPDYDNVRRALQWADDQDDSSSLVRLTARLYGYWALGRRLVEAHQWLSRAVDRADTDLLRARVLGHFAHIHGMAVSWRDAESLAEEAVELIRGTGDRRALTWSLAQLSNIQANVWHFAEAEANLREAICLASETGDIHGHAFALFQLGRMQCVIDPHAARDALDEAQRLAASIGAHYLEHMSEACIGWTDAQLGDLRKAIRTNARALEGLRSVGDGWFYSSILVFASYLIALAGEADRAARLLEELASVTRELGWASHSISALGPVLVAAVSGAWDDALDPEEQLEGPDRDIAILPLSIAAVQRGDLGTARRAVDVLVATSPPSWRRQAHLIRAEIALAEGDPTTACRLSREFVLSADPLLIAPVYEVLALNLFASATARLRGHRDAVRLFAAADARAHEIGMSTSTELARLHVAELDGIRAELAAPDFDALWTEGSHRPWSEVLGHLGRGRGERRRPRTGWESLTPTEREVADLVLQGLSNKAIASHLLISVATVKTHLTHTFAKIGVVSRAELIAATRRDEAPSPPAAGG